MQSGPSSTPPSGLPPTSVRKSFNNIKRRLVQTVAEGIAGAERVSKDEVEIRKLLREFHNFENQIRTLQDQIRHWRNMTMKWLDRVSFLSQSFEDFFTLAEEDDELKSLSSCLAVSHLQIKKVVSKSIMRILEIHGLEPLQNILDQDIAHIKSLIARHKNLEIDISSYTRRLKGGEDNFQKLKLKLENTRNDYNLLHDELLTQLRNLQKDKFTFVKPIFLTLAACQFKLMQVMSDDYDKQFQPGYEQAKIVESMFEEINDLISAGGPRDPSNISQSRSRKGSLTQPFSPGLRVTFNNFFAPSSNRTSLRKQYNISSPVSSQDSPVSLSSLNPLNPQTSPLSSNHAIRNDMERIYHEFSDNLIENTKDNLKLGYTCKNTGEKYVLLLEFPPSYPSEKISVFIQTPKSIITRQTGFDLTCPSIEWNTLQGKDGMVSINYNDAINDDSSISDIVRSCWNWLEAFQVQDSCGHPLEDYKIIKGTAECDICSKVVTQEDTCFQCYSCNILVCEPCQNLYGIQLAPTRKYNAIKMKWELKNYNRATKTWEVMEKHLLRCFDAPNDNFSCDICGVKIESGDLVFGCRPCNFDICESCQEKYEIEVYEG